LHDFAGMPRAGQFAAECRGENYGVSRAAAKDWENDRLAGVLVPESRNQAANRLRREQRIIDRIEHKSGARRNASKAGA
jgi:hypothetical protein